MNNFHLQNHGKCFSSENLITVLNRNVWISLWMEWSKQQRQITLSIVTSQSTLHYVLLWRQLVGPRTHELLFTRFSCYSPDFPVNIACYFLQEVVFSANGIAYNNRLYNNLSYLPSSLVYSGRLHVSCWRRVRIPAWHCAIFFSFI
jgi:hypothetical protein